MKRYARSSNDYALDGVDLKKHPECKDMPLVFAMAKMYSRIWNGQLPGMEFDDLIQIGYLTLRNCYELYDESVGPYPAYIGQALKHAMTVAITRNRHMIHVPGCAHRLANCLDHDEPLPFGDGKFGLRRRSAKKAQQVRRMARRKVEDAMLVLATGLDTKWIDLEALEHGLRQLPERERRVLCLHYGLEDGEPLTFEKIGEQWPNRQVTRQNVQYVHAAGIEHIRQVMGVGA